MATKSMIYRKNDGNLRILPVRGVCVQHQIHITVEDFKSHTENPAVKITHFPNSLFPP